MDGKFSYKPNGKYNGFSALRITGAVFAIIGTVFTGLGAAFWLYIGEFVLEEDRIPLIVTFGAMGVVFLAVGVGLLIAHGAKRKRMTTLMREGSSYEAQVVNAYFSNVQVNHRPGVILECRYVDDRGASHLVKSDTLWNTGLLRQPSDYKARVWVNPFNAKSYYVEVLDNGLTGSADYDDR